MMAYGVFVVGDMVDSSTSVKIGIKLGEKDEQKSSEDLSLLVISNINFL